MHYLCYFELELLLELKLLLKSALEFKLPYRVINVELLAVVAEDAVYYTQL